MFNLGSFFSTPKYLSMDLVGLDLSNSGIRVMKLKKNKTGLIPDKFHEEIFTKNYDLGGEDLSELDKNEIIQYLKKVKVRLGLKYVVCSLPQTKTYIFETELPAETKDDLEGAILFKIEENVPFSAEEVEFDYFIDKNLVTKDKIPVVVSVFPKKIIQNYTNLLKKAGMFPASFSSESVSLLKSIVKDGDTKAYLLARILPNKISLGISENDIIQYTSEINIDIEKIISDYNSKEARLLAKELNKILIYWFTNEKLNDEHEKIQRVFLAGQGALTESLSQFLESHLKIDVDPANVWVNCFNSRKFIPKIKKENTLDYAVAIGLAIKAYKHKD